MPQAKKGRLNYRCPCCFARELDIDMFYDEEKQEYYCIRCSFRGKEEEVIKLNEINKYKYKNLRKRVTSFNEDNEPLTFKEHK